MARSDLATAAHGDLCYSWNHSSRPEHGFQPGNSAMGRYEPKAFVGDRDSSASGGTCSSSDRRCRARANGERVRLASLRVRTGTADLKELAPATVERASAAAYRIRVTLAQRARHLAGEIGAGGSRARAAGTGRDGTRARASCRARKRAGRQRDGAIAVLGSKQVGKFRSLPPSPRSK
jgi:hypothetical protein